MENLKNPWTTISSKQVYGSENIAFAEAVNMVIEGEDADSLSVGGLLRWGRIL